MTTLSIVIPTYNGLDHLRRCLPSVVRFAPQDAQILVVDDASTDDSVAWMREYYPRVEVVALKDNRGFCGAVNEGIARSTGDVIELLNNDTEVAEGWAHRCLEHFEDPSVGSVAPLVLQMDNPDVVDSAGQNYHICGWATNRGYRQPLANAYRTPCRVFGPSASSGFYRRSVLEKTGGFLPEFGAYLEDTDLAFRLRWAGAQCVFEPSAVVYHKGSGSYSQQSAQVIRHLARNEELVWWINLTGWQICLGLLPHLGFLLVRLASKIIRGGLWPFLVGKWQALTLGRFVWRQRRFNRQLAMQTQAIDLRVARDVRVLFNGVTWLRSRRCA